MFNWAFVPGWTINEFPAFLWTCISNFIKKCTIITMGGLGGVNNSKFVHNFESNSRVNLPAFQSNQDLLAY